MKNDLLKFSDVYINNAAATVGKKESEGPLKETFDLHEKDEYFGCDNFEAAESEMIRRNLNLLYKKAGIDSINVDMYFGGDLINQCVPSNYAITETSTPFIGLYGACSTIIEAIICSSVFIQGGFINNAISFASSHFCASERQYRFPLEYGSVRTPTSQNTVTGTGAFLLSNKPGPIKIEHAVIGKIVDKGVKDSNNMGAAMACAAVDTLIRFFNSTQTSPKDYDMIYTGDLGYEGHNIAKEMFMLNGIEIESNFTDCGILIYDKNNQDTHSGGSGCGCIASVFAGHIFKELEKKNSKNILLVGTGALLNPNSIFEKHSIPGIAHAIHVQVEE